MQSDFEILFHEHERILEVRYPQRPTLESFDRYEKAVRETITSISSGWKCLVDQSRLAVMPPELGPRLATLNAWAREHGMQVTARVVKQSATAELQVNRLFKGAAIVAHTRDEAWKSLLKAPL
jgi:hypothetical protein